MLDRCLEALGRMKTISKVVVVSPEPVRVPRCTNTFVDFKGKEDDVLGRYARALDVWLCDYVLRVTADCPLLDPALADHVVSEGVNATADYCSNVVVGGFPCGLDAELISRYALRSINHFVVDKRLREHVTLAIREDKDWQRYMTIVSIEPNKSYSHLKWSVDTKTDLERVREMVAGVPA